MELRPSPGTASLDNLTDVQVSSATNGQVLYVAGGSWVNGTPTAGGLADLGNSQTITGSKTFTANVLVDNGVEVRFFELDANGSNFIGLRAPDSLSGDVTYQLPAAGTSGQFWKLGSSNVISWASLAIADLSDASDLVLLAGRAGGQTIKGSPTSGQDLTLQANNSSNGYIVVQASGGIKLKTQSSLIMEDSAGGEYVALRASDPISSSYIMEMPSAPGTAGQVLQISGVGGSTLSTTWATPGATVSHSSLTGLSADDHAQYAALAGRSGGQTLKGDTASSGNLILESTANAIKGQVRVAAGSVLAMRGTTSNAGQMRMYDEDESNYCGFKAPTNVAANSVYTMPDQFPASSKWLTSDSSGVLTWGTPGGGGSGVDVTDDYTGATIDVSAAPQLWFDSAAGFTVSSSGGNAKITLTSNSVPVAKITAGSAGQVVVTSGGASTWGAALIAGGGTGLTSYTAGDTLYYASSTALSKLAIGTAGQQLTVNSAGTAPSWAEPSATEVESWRFEYTSSTTVTLKRLGNSKLRITINGRVYESNSDVTATNPSSSSIFDGGIGAADTAYYAYLRDASGTLTIDFSTIAPNTQVPGVYAYKNGYTTHRYIGKVILNSVPAFVDGAVWSANNRFVRTAQIFNDCRISGSSSETVPSSDVGSASTIYLHPHRGNRITLYNSTTGEWELCYLASAASLALSGLTSGKNYDVFAYLDHARVKMELGPAWTDDTNRSATTITRTDGVYTKSTDQTRLYLGTIRATGASTTQDAASARYIFNYFNQEPRNITVTSPSSASYNSATIRQWGASSANQVNFLLGVGQNVSASINMCLFPGTVSSQIALGGMGLDLTTNYIGNLQRVYNRGYESTHSAHYSAYVAAGYHYIAALQHCGASYTCSFTEYEITGVIRA